MVICCFLKQFDLCRSKLDQTQEMLNSSNNLLETSTQELNDFKLQEIKIKGQLLNQISDLEHTNALNAQTIQTLTKTADEVVSLKAKTEEAEINLAVNNKNC
jgi:hypothetical protein